MTVGQLLQNAKNENTKLAQKILDLRKSLEKMKNCSNCKHSHIEQLNTNKYTFKCCFGSDVEHTANPFFPCDDWKYMGDKE